MICCEIFSPLICTEHTDATNELNKINKTQHCKRLRLGKKHFTGGMKLFSFKWSVLKRLNQIRF
jgi:hypothetical protein